MAATEVVRLDTVMCVVVRNAEKLLRKRAFVDSEVHGIQTAGRNECACFKQNIFGTLMSCRPAPLFFLFYYVSWLEYIVQHVLILKFTSSTVSSGKFSFCEGIFTSCFVHIASTFCVPQAHTILHKIQHKWCVVALQFKNHSRLFSNKKQRNKPGSKQEKHPVVHCRETRIRGLFTLLTGDDASKVNQSWSRPTYFILHLGCMDPLRCSLSVINPK